MTSPRGQLIVIAIVSALLAACGTASLPAGAERFEVPTYDWGRGDGMGALLSGRLAFTEDGCTLLVSMEGDGLAQPVVFPNAAGLRFENGVRAVIEADSGKVYAVEGQEFSYGGGWVRPPESWTEQCGDYSPDDVAVINDDPANPAPTTDPEPYAGDLPTEVPSREDRGWYAVPTFAWQPADGGDSALLDGTVTMSDDGCATVESPDGIAGLVIPNAWGKNDEGYAGGRAIFAWFDTGSSGVMAEDGMEVSFAGGFTDVAGDHGQQWNELCPDTPVDTLFLVQDDTPWE
ncbi:MAG: hypothetical protein Q4G67_11220 [Actinomycetia bacterium]|nr:hypothetical protein [Actinomycetes bacterium]